MSFPSGAFWHCPQPKAVLDSLAKPLCSEGFLSKQTLASLSVSLSPTPSPGAQWIKVRFSPARGAVGGGAGGSSEGLEEFL